MAGRLEIAYFLIALLGALALWVIFHLTREHRMMGRRRRERRRSRKAEVAAKRDAAAEA